MGLDMYLNKKTYVKQWDHQSPEEKYEVAITKGGNSVEGIKASRVKHIEEEIGYWRKANHIHNWFVENVQDGIDNCGEYYVSKPSLKALLELCKKVEADNSLAEELLPYTVGFFFGSTEYDEYYFESIGKTISILEEALECGGSNYYYSSSW
jgi:hypothetical protein